LAEKERANNRRAARLRIVDTVISGRVMAWYPETSQDGSSGTVFAGALARNALGSHQLAGGC
jgi:hypothetical protein